MNVCSECGHLNRYREIGGVLVLERVGPKEEIEIRRKFPKVAVLLTLIAEEISQGSS